MKSFSHLVNSAIVIAISSQMLLLPIARAEEQIPASPVVVAAPVSAPVSRAESRFFRRFDRKFKHFQRDVDFMLDQYSDDEIAQSYLETISNYEEHGHYDIAAAMKKDYESTHGNIRDRLTNMASESAHVAATAFLKAQIAQAGGYVAFAARAKAERKKNLNVGCEVLKVTSWVVITPVVFAGMMMGLVGFTGLIVGAFTPGVILLAGGSIGIEGFAFPWFMDQLVYGCYNDHSETLK